MEYFVTTNLKHNGRRFVAGDTIDLSDADATRLLDLGVVAGERPVAPAPEPDIAVEPAPQPEVAGKPMETGEPSIDGREGERTVDNATDVTPGAHSEPQNGMRALSPDVRADAPNAPQTGTDAPVEPSDDMKRDELEALALSYGVSEADAKAAPNKTALVELIDARREQSSEPEHDPSVNL